MLEDNKIRFDQERKEELDIIARKADWELGYEMGIYEWKLIKLSNGNI
jgi:hypothetical protein